MNDVMAQVLTFATSIGFIVALVMQMLKSALKIDKKYIPLASFIVGLIIGLAAVPFTDMGLILRLWAGGIAGWMASGTYDTIKKTIVKK